MNNQNILIWLIGLTNKSYHFTVTKQRLTRIWKIKILNIIQDIFRDDINYPIKIWWNLNKFKKDLWYDIIQKDYYNGQFIEFYNQWITKIS